MKGLGLAILAAASVLAGARTARGGPGEEPAASAASAPVAPVALPTAALAAGSKKEQLLAEKARARASLPERARWRAELRRRMGRKPAALVNVYNTWTHESLAVETGPRAGAPAAELVDRFLRCHFTDDRTSMDARLFGVLLKAAARFKAERVEIVSGFRAPKYNLVLRKKGRFVARKSEHTFGNAVDFRLPGVATERLRNWARRQRVGGVGYYRGDRFIHLDTGPVRYWAE